MNLLIEPQNNIWVAGNISRENLKRRIAAVDVNISDLDGTDARSSARYLALRAVGAGYSNLDYWRWVKESGLAWGKAKLGGTERVVEIEQWKKYLDSFLRSEDALNEIEKIFTPAKVKKLLYPGVAEFYTVVKADKFYCTRNLEPVARSFARGLNFLGVRAEVEDKEEFMEQFVEDHPYYQYYLLRGDSQDEEAMYEVLRSKKQNKKIEEATFIYCSNDLGEKKMSKSADINTSKNQIGLFNLISEKIFPRVDLQ